MPNSIFSKCRWFFIPLPMLSIPLIIGITGFSLLSVSSAHATEPELVCTCGVDTGNIAGDDNDNTASDDNMIANDNVAGDGVSNSGSDDNIVSNDNIAGDDEDNIDNSVASVAVCTCADGTAGFWAPVSGGQPVVPGAFTVPKSERELHGK